jgi:hypothetical protein
VRPWRILLLYAQTPLNKTLSYQSAWPRHFIANPRFRCTAANVADHNLTAKMRTLLTASAWAGDAVVLLHSVFSNGCLLGGRVFDAIRRLPQPKAFFIGNEYKLMPEKMQFCDELGVALLVSQGNSKKVHQLYRERLQCVVVGIPHTGLDPCIFRSTTDSHARPIDLGYRAFAGPPYLGHREREAIAEYFVNHADSLEIRVDVSTDPTDRFDEQGWADFLNTCRGQLGTEAGTDYFELTDETRLRVNAYVAEKPEVGFDELRRRFFSGPKSPLPLRIISGRNIEAAGTRTAQVLFDGHYDGFFEPDVHYIPLRKDFSNIEEVMSKFHDEAFREAIVNNAYRVAVDQFSYDRLIDRFAESLKSVM